MCSAKKLCPEKVVFGLEVDVIRDVYFGRL